MSDRLLAIESATDWLSIALCEGEVVVGLQEADGARRHAAELMPMVASGLEQVGWSIDSLAALAVSTGPGSFTSLRIGLATAKGLAFGRRLRGIGVPTLEAMALGVFEAGSDLDEDGELLVLLDARRGQWYAGSWRPGPPGERLRPGLPEGLYDPARLAVDLGRPVVGCSPERAGWADALRAAGVELVGTIEGARARPRADHVARLARQLWSEGEDLEVAALAARYLRRADAEARRLGLAVEPGELARLGSEPG